MEPLHELTKHDLSERDITRILHSLTGQVYTFATASGMRWGKDGKVERMGEDFPNGFYELMPHATNDGFFDWYCDRRMEHQIFVSQEIAALHFIYYWLEWSYRPAETPADSQASN